MFAEELITQVRNLAQLPTEDEDLTDTFILTQAYLGLLERFTHPIILTRSGSWLHSYTFETTAGVSRYRLPGRSVVQGLEKIECAYAQGEANADSSGFYTLNVLTNLQATDYEGRQSQYRPVAFTYIGDAVEIFPTPAANWVVRVWYYLRPSTLETSDVLLTRSSGLNAIQPGSMSGTYNLLFEDGALDTYVTNATPIDLQFGDGNAEYIALDLLGTVVSPGVVRCALTPNQADMLLRAVGTNPAVSVPGGGDVWGFVAGVSFLIPLPQELCNALVSYVGAVVLADKGDAEKAQVFSQKAELAIKNIVDIAIPRSKSQPSLFKTRSGYLRRRVSRFGMRGGFGF